MRSMVVGLRNGDPFFKLDIFGVMVGLFGYLFAESVLFDLVEDDDKDQSDDEEACISGILFRIVIDEFEVEDLKNIVLSVFSQNISLIFLALHFDDALNIVKLPLDITLSLVIGFKEQ